MNREAVKYGLTKTAIEKVCTVFAGFREIEKAILYGSRAKGNFKPGSDIDLTLYGEALTAELRSAIASALDDLLLPYTIDLSIFDELDHVKLREHIERVGVVFYERAKQGITTKNGWQTKTLGEVSAISYGYTESATSEPVGPQFLRITDIQDDWVEWATVPYCKIAPADLPKYRLASGDIVFARTGATTGKSFLVNDPPEAVCASYLIRLRLLDKSLLPKFVSLFFQTTGYWKAIKEGSSGSAQGGFNATKLGSLILPIPPISEQQRIVGVLDEAFAGLATAQANAEKNLQNARALFASHLQSVFTQRGKGWIEKPLNEVCEVKDGTHDSPKYVDDGIPFVTQKNVREDGLSFEKTKFISQEDHEDFYRRSNAASGDILISMIGANRGMACIVDDSRTFSIKNVGLVKQNKSINQQFLLFFLKSPQAAAYVRSASKGGAQEFVGLTELRRWPIPFPPPEQQDTLADQFVNLRTETQRLESLYEQKLAALAALKKSLLHEAFTGKL